MKNATYARIAADLDPELLPSYVKLYNEIVADAVTLHGTLVPGDYDDAAQLAKDVLDDYAAPGTTPAETAAAVAER